MSLDAKQRHDTSQQAEKGKAKDVASLLSSLTKLGNPNLKRPKDFDTLAGSGYLALIHADGNGVGSGTGESSSPSERAKFFHKNRVLLRRALKVAIDTLCPDAGMAPLIPLMLGGDDLLLVCRAEIALPFIVQLCDELEAIQKDVAGIRLTLGVGVVFARPTVPIHRLHDVAEQLASSAKRRFRGLKEGEAKRSVVDWAVFSTSWISDPAEVRRRDWLRGRGNDHRVLSQRPVDVLGQENNSLQGLLNNADKLDQAPRSQLRYLVDQLPRGRTLAELAFEELPEKARGSLADAGVKTPWHRPENSNGPWLTSLLDLVEITEIARLGRKNPENAQSEREVIHAQY